VSEGDAGRADRAVRRYRRGHREGGGGGGGERSAGAEGARAHREQQGAQLHVKYHVTWKAHCQKCGSEFAKWICSDLRMCVHTAQNRICKHLTAAAGAEKTTPMRLAPIAAAVCLFAPAAARAASCTNLSATLTFGP